MECVSWSLDVSGEESAIIAGADSNTIINYQRFYLVPAAIRRNGWASIYECVCVYVRPLDKIQNARYLK